MKMRIMGVLGSLLVRGDPSSSAMSPFHRTHDFLFVFNRNYASILYRFRDTASHFFEICQLRPTQHAFGAHVGVGPVRISTFLAQENYNPSAITRLCLRVPMFSHFGRNPSCDRDTHSAPWHTEQ